MNTIACVEVENYLGRGAEYVERLYLGALKWCAEPFHFQVLTDSIERHWSTQRRYGIDLAQLGYEPHEGQLRGWWNKIELFCPRMFPIGDKILYLDLDTLIVGPLEPMFKTSGIIHLRDWGWKNAMYGSGVMVWNAGQHADIWSKWSPRVAKEFQGDQDWIHSLGGWPALPPPLVRSYRYHCKEGPPKDCSIVAFHGKPKPHELNNWAGERWRNP